MSLGSVFFLTQFTCFLFSTYYMNFNLLRFFFLFDMHNTSICVWRCLWYKGKQNVPTWHDLLHQEESNLSSSLTIIITFFFFFFCFQSSAFCSYPGVYFQVFFFQEIEIESYITSICIFKISLICLCTRELARGLVLFPSKHLETDHLLPFVI